MPREVLLDPALIDCSQVVADRETINRWLPQRFEMEHLTAVVLVDTARHLVAGYKDVRPDEFWVRGHMPDYPLLPGVVMCEAAAQLAAYYSISQGIIPAGKLLGLGGLEEVRFRAAVRPGDRLLLVGHGTKLDRRKTVFDVQGFVGEKMAFEATVIGVPIPSAGGR